MTSTPVGEATEQGSSGGADHVAHGDAPWWQAVQRWGRTLAGREALLLLGAAAVVQLLMTYRQDLPSHVVAGGAASLLLAGAVPGTTARRLGPWTAVGVFTVVCVVGWIVEAVLFGPFDLVDAAFTFAGAFVVSDASTRVATSPTTERLRVAAVAVGLLVLAFTYHSLVAGGPP